jgi:hypothetical protein
MRTDIHASSGIQAHDTSVRAIKDHASDRAATVIGHITLKFVLILAYHLRLCLLPAGFPTKYFM